MMILFVICLGLALASIWVSVSYGSPGSIGVTGVAIAALTLLNTQTGWPWIVFLFAGGLFLIGMFVSRSIDDVFHWGALLVNLLTVAETVIGFVLGWNIWSHNSSAPTVLLVAAGLALLYVAYRMARWLGRQFKPATS